MNARSLVIARAVAVIGGIGVLAAGVTFAQGLTSNPVTLSDNTISSATASLQVSTDNVTYGASKAGFDFSGVVPASTGTGPGLGTPSAPQTFFLKNNGTTDLTLSAFVPALPTFTVTPTATVSNGGVFVSMTCTSTASGTLSLVTGNDLTHLSTSPGVTVLGGTLKAGDTVSCTSSVSMDSTAVTTPFSSISSSGFDMQFTGSSS